MPSAVYVPPRGRTPNRVLLVGKFAGREEARRGYPFCGRSGEDQRLYLSRYDLIPDRFRITNVVPEYVEGLKNPTPEQLARFTPELIRETFACAQPASDPSAYLLLIVAVGQLAARFYLGEGVTLESTHGLPHRPGAYDPAYASRAPATAIILPIHHPALAFHDTKGDTRSLIAWDYSRVAYIYDLITRRQPIPFREDLYAGREVYRDVSGHELRDLISAHDSVLSIDTEGTPDNPWSIQVSDTPGSAYVLRTDRDYHSDFSVGINHLHSLISDSRRPVQTIFHSPYDVPMCRAMNLDITRASGGIFDTMHALYLLRVEPQGLKPAAWRWCGMKMVSHDETIGVLGLRRQVEYLERVSCIPFSTLPKPESSIIFENDGTSHYYKPNPIQTTAGKILADYANNLLGIYKKYDEETGEGIPVDIVERWKGIGRPQRRQVEKLIGRMPYGSMRALALEDFDRAIIYSAKDADATLRLSYELKKELSAWHLRSAYTRRHPSLLTLQSQDMEVLPIVCEMEANGLPASRSAFQTLASDLDTHIDSVRQRLIHTFNSDQPFNPGSSKQTAEIMSRYGLQGAELTDSGDMSTSQKSIKHLEDHPLIAGILEYRQYEHIKSGFCKKLLERFDEDDPDDIQRFHARIKMTRTTSRRPASEDPNPLAFPTASEIGNRIRECFVAPPGKVLVGCDQSQVEMRVLAHLSQDPFLIHAFLNNEDIHTQSAARVFNIPLSEVDKRLHRLPAKKTSYGIVYGIGGMGLAAQMRMLGLDNWPAARCNKMIHDWLDLCSGVRDYIERIKAETRRYELVQSHWGMVRYLPGINSRDSTISEEAGRQAVNHTIQDMAQGMIQRAMAYLAPIVDNLNRDLECDIEWLLEPHDELIFLCDEGEPAEVLRDIVIDALSNHCGVELCVPVLAEGSIAKNWGKLK